MVNESNLLFNIINKVVDKKMKNISYDRQGVVVTILDNNYVEALIDGNKCKVKNGTNISFSRGDMCLIHYISGNANNKVIIARL